MPMISKPVATCAITALLVAACAPMAPELPSAGLASAETMSTEDYIIGPLDQITVHVFRNPELSAEKVQVRPDGRVTIPLVNDLEAAGKTPAQLETEIRARLAEYVENPIVSVILTQFSGTFSQQVRIVGATEKPASMPYRANMTLLDAVIAVGGLSEFAAGNRAKLIRTNKSTGAQTEYSLRIGDLLRKGDSSANVRLEPGDVIIIPESTF